MKKILFTMMIVALLVCPAMAARYRQHQLTIVDEFGDAVTNITQISIFDAGTSSATTIYPTRAGGTMTNPITTGSTGSTFVQSLGLVSWFQAAPDYKVTITDGTRSLTIDSRAEGDTRFPWYANYIGALSSFNIGDNNDLNFGTDTDVVGTWENANDILSWIPAVDGVSFDIGDTDAAKQFVFHVYVGGVGGGGLTIDEGTSAFTWLGSGAVTINDSGTGTTSIHAGAATGTITIGSGTSGAWAIDGTSTGAINCDAALGITTTDGSADITVDAVAGSVIIDGGEAAADAVTITATGTAGGIDITSLADIDITTTGAATEDISITNTGGSVIITATEGAADAIVLNASTAVGGIDITSNADIDITTTGAATEDISITNTGGSIIVTATENVQNSMHIEVNGGTSESINLYSNQGTGASATTEHDASVQIQSDDGGIGIYTTGDVADAFRLETNGGTNETITINNLQGTGAGAITIAANAAGGDLNLDSVLGRIEIEAEEDVANALYLIADGSTASTIEIFNDTGTAATEGAASIQLLSDVGGIAIQSGLDGAAITLLADAGTSEIILINADQGTGVGSITLDSDDGGITINTGTGASDGINYNGRTDSLIVLEGTADDHETSLTFTDPTADGTINFPDSADEGAAGADVAWVADAGTTTKDASDAAIPVTDAVVQATSGAASAWSLPNGEEGQILTVVIVTDGGEATITPDTCAGCGWATAVLTDDIDTITFMYVDDTVGWMVIGTAGDGTNLVALTQ